MRVALGQFMDPTEERLQYFRQLGLEDVILNMYKYDPDYAHISQNDSMPLSGEGEWSHDQLLALRERVEAAGLRLNAIENVPISFSDDVKLGRIRSAGSAAGASLVWSIAHRHMSSEPFDVTTM